MDVNPKPALKHISTLDILRTIGAFSVVVWHYQHFYYIYPQVFSQGFRPENQPFFNSLELLYSRGHLAVQLFWMISGVVLVHIYGNQRVKLLSFLQNRFARLYPLHVVTLGVVGFIQVLSNHYFHKSIIYENNDVKHFILHILFIPSLLNPGEYSFNEPIWSVTVEVFAYIIFGLIAVTKFTLIKSIVATLLAAGLSIPFNNQVVIDSRVISAVFFFFSGTTLYLASKRISVRYQLIFGSVSILIYGLQARNLFGDSKLVKLLCSHEYFIVFLFGGIVIMLLLISNCLPNSKFLNNRVFLGFGNLSYSIYLWHVPIQISIMLIGMKYEVDIARVANLEIFFLTYLAIVTLVARFSFKLIEEPLRSKLRARS